MAEVKWIKITTDIFDDEKILLIESLPDAYAIITVWFKLLCLAGKQNNSGVFLLGQMPYTDKMLATIFRMKESTVTMALQTFEQFGMVEIVDGVITIPNWGKHQSLDQLESKKEYMRNYMTEYRKKQKALTSGKPVCKTNSKTNVIQADKEREKEKERDLEEEGEEKCASTTSKLEKMGGTLGQGVLMLTDEQVSDLLDKLSIDEYDLYCKKLSDYIIANPEKTFKSHYQTILKWVSEDRKKVQTW